MIKKILRSRLFHLFAASFFFLYFKFIQITCRITIDNQKALDDLLDSNTPIVIMTWHGRLFMTPYIMTLNKKRRRIFTVISRHNDGAMIARALDMFGFDHVRGSSNRTKEHKKGPQNRGGSTILRHALTILRNGDILCITPDGPTGPRMRLKPNILPIAQRTNATIITIAFSSSRAKIVKSWDRFMLPLPFSRLHIVIGDPTPLDEKSTNGDSNHTNSDLKNTGKILENQLNTITSMADTVCNQTPVDPA